MLSTKFARHHPNSTPTVRRSYEGSVFYRSFSSASRVLASNYQNGIEGIMADKMLRVAIIGCGRMGHEYARFSGMDDCLCLHASDTQFIPESTYDSLYCGAGRALLNL